MDAEAVEFMLYLKRNVAELKRLGSEWEMSTDEINSCIDKALENEKNIPEDQTNKIKPREIWLKFCHGIKFMFKVFGIIMAVLFGMLILVSYHESSGNFVGKVLQPYGYPIFRLIRLATLPIHNMMNITSYYDSECLMDNPFYQEPTQECDLCQDTHDVEELRTGQIMFPLVKRYSRQQRPFVFNNKGKPDTGVEFVDLVSMYQMNQDVIDRSVSKFYSSQTDIHNLDSLFALKTDYNLEKKKGLSVHWVSRNMASSQLLRKLFPRPPFVPPESEVALEKIVYIDSPQSQQYEVVGGFYQAVYVNVVKGKRKAVLTSVENCSQLCSPIHIDLDEGDILVFGPTMWRLNIMPNMDGIGIVFVGSFTL